MRDWRRERSTWLLLAVSAAALSVKIGPAGALVLPFFLVVQVPTELARLAGLASAGATRPRLRVGMLTLTAVAEKRPSPRQLAISDSVALVVPLVLAPASYAVLPRPYAAAYAYASFVMVTYLSGIYRCVWHDTIFETVRQARELRRADAALDAAAAVSAGPAAHDERVRILASALARDPSNLVLSAHLVVRFVMALRFDEAERELARVAAMRSARRRGRRRALLTWADLVLSYPEPLGAHVQKAVDVLRAGDLGCGFTPTYLGAVLALRTGDPATALARADEAIARWERGEVVGVHAVGAAHGVRAASLLAMGRRDAAVAAVAAGTAIDPNCAIPDVLDEVRAALAA